MGAVGLILFIDADALAKLAHWDLLDHLPAFTGVPLERCNTLESIVHRARRARSKPDGRLFLCAEAATRVCDGAGRMGASITPDPATLQALQNVAAIDAGEAVLLSALIMQPASRLLTGDKRALRALATTPEPLRAAFASRILIIEQVLLAALRLHDIGWLRQHVCPWKDADKAVAIAMGSRCDADASACREGLDAYVREIDALCRPTLLARLGPP